MKTYQLKKWQGIYQMNELSTDYFVLESRFILHLERKLVNFKQLEKYY